MSASQLGRVQLLIMQVLWDKECATAREITDAINQSEQIAHSTVQTLLRGLEEKKAIRHRPRRTHVRFLSSSFKEEKFKQSATSDLLQRVFAGNATSLVAHLLEERKRVSATKSVRFVS